jgi:hypothetical protein
MQGTDGRRESMQMADDNMLPEMNRSAAGIPPILMKSLCGLLAFRIDPLRASGAQGGHLNTKGVNMSDIIFLALGAGAFALFGTYARLIAQI